ncbi:MAG: hypothetical protein N2Z84_04995, partial [Atribacterota bacterium]|nr:hypothetical protein [Atribacterota bacterium]
MVKQILRGRLPVPMEVISSPPIPCFADQNTLFILSSYSGNTKETLGVAHTVRKKNLPAVVLTSGGELQALLPRESVLRIPSGLQPRCALGYLLGNLLGLFENLFPTLSLEAEVNEAVTLLRDLLPHYSCLLY